MHTVPEDFNTNYKDIDVMIDTRESTNQSPRGSDSGIDSDCTDGNLSWLLNYKIHELPPVPGKCENVVLSCAITFTCLRRLFNAAVLIPYLFDH